ncbi:hypothetical protein P8C59_005195 [Phyllachora maydis]|uniref:Rab-GAP TBC domain-containing protein n=1 Tax=Phyllachora maydis TaxID=1825666 RepID=A0AAD9I471_9PEZI|nr:hypothetical protein P8C59_005195 [Phyllachora maydis]
MHEDADEPLVCANHAVAPESPTETDAPPSGPETTPVRTASSSQRQRRPLDRPRKRSWNGGPDHRSSPPRPSCDKGTGQSLASPGPTGPAPARDASDAPDPFDALAPLLMTSIPDAVFFDDFKSLSFSTRGSVMFGGKRIFPPASASPAAASPAAASPAAASPAAASASAASASAAVLGPSPPMAPPIDRNGSIAGLGIAGLGIAGLGSPSSPRPRVFLLRPREPPCVPREGPSPRSAVSSPAESPLQQPSAPRIHVMSTNAERESQKVRSLYESADGLDWQDGAQGSFAERLEPPGEVSSDEEEKAADGFPCTFHKAAAPPVTDAAPLRSSASPWLDAPSLGPHTTAPPTVFGTPPSASSLSPRPESRLRRDYELAGGLEDWEDVEGADVDRYGFITERRPASPRTEAPGARSPQYSPKPRNLLTKRPDSIFSSSPLASHIRIPSRKVSARSLNTHASETSNLSRRSARSSIRAVTNKLPHNKERRWMDEASDMLALQPGLADIDEEGQVAKHQEALRRKETERSEKWRKMAKVNKKGREGEGMDFEFDVKNPKLIERTWKGIPDCWRAAAWRSFLLASARAWKSEATDEVLAAEFRRLQDVSSTDDVQIDLDVPRTINRHVLFRRRYRGGQRLLFRVLHAIALYFPDTGYVQGMASLAATLLCYYDEELCFAMLVRLWDYRGLRRLYQPGFPGLMAALKEFEGHWLAQDKDVASKLNELLIDPTAYCTRWYLTLFNLSLPFSAQLRVWDIFMLLGESPPPVSNPPTLPNDADCGAAQGTCDPVGPTEAAPVAPSPPGFDVLHAASAALIHALRDILLGADFENAMKTLTSWVHVTDEELLMKVTHAKYKLHRGKRKDRDGGGKA